MFILSAIFSGVVKIGTAILEFFIKNPMALVAVACLVGGLWFGYGWGKSSNEAKYQELVQTMKEEVEARNAKITQIETDSKEAADKASAKLAVMGMLIKDISDGYEKKLESALKNPKIKTVIVPGAKEYVYVNQEGEISCRRLPDTFTQTINDMIKATNGQTPK